MGVATPLFHICRRTTSVKPSGGIVPEIPTEEEDDRLHSVAAILDRLPASPRGKTENER